jgi:hypothetical protein
MLERTVTVGTSKMAGSEGRIVTLSDYRVALYSGMA